MIINNKYKVSWKHNDESAKKYLSNSELREAVREIITTNPSRSSSIEAIDKLIASQEKFSRSFSKCFIEDLTTGEVHEGVGLVHPGCGFDRKKGMEVSFRDAVLGIGSRVTRRMLWMVYLKEHKKDVKIKEIDSISINTKIDPNANRSKYSL